MIFSHSFFEPFMHEAVSQALKHVQDVVRMQDWAAARTVPPSRGQRKELQSPSLKNYFLIWVLNYFSEENCFSSTILIYIQRLRRW